MSIAGALALATCVLALSCIPLASGPLPTRLAFTHPDARALEDAGWSRGLVRWEALRVGIAAMAGVGGALLGAPAALAVVALAAPSVWIRLRAEAARDRARRSLGTIVATAEAGLRSGTSLPDALRRAADASGDDLATRPVREALRAFDLGAALDVTLAAAADRAREPRSRLALGTLALGIGERLPRERLADLLAALSERIAFEQQLEDEVHARAAGARQQQRLLAALVPGLALYLALTMPMLSATLATDLGRFVLIPIAAALEVAGIVLGRRVVGGALR